MFMSITARLYAKKDVRIIIVSKGWNDIILCRCGASFVVDQIVIETVKGAAACPCSADESLNNIAKASAVKIGELCSHTRQMVRVSFLLFK